MLKATAGANYLVVGQHGQMQQHSLEAALGAVVAVGSVVLASLQHVPSEPCVAA